MSSLAARNELVNWQVAPAEFEISNYDQPKFSYRAYVEQFVKVSGNKINKKIFYTISTNVLCADISSSRDNIDPIDRDLYLPLEIAIYKWSLKKATSDNQDSSSKVWLINPGYPTKGSNCHAMDHKKRHKIDFGYDYHEPQLEYVHTDYANVMKEINIFLNADRTVFSLNLNQVRQDLGCLKWLNKMSDYKARPIKVYSLEDLYVVLTRQWIPIGLDIGQGVARFRMETFDGYDTELQCIYHKAKAKESEGECQYCAKSLSIGRTKILIEDLNRTIIIAAEAETNPSQPSATT